MLVAGLTGCGDSESDASESTTTAEPIQISYHPCDQLPMSVMEDLGLRNMSRDERTNPVSLDCVFVHRNPRFGAGVHAMGQSFEDVVGDPRLVEKERMTVSGRTVSVSDFTAGVSCMASIDIEPGVLQIGVDYNEGSSRPQDELNNVDEACAEAKKIVNAVGPYLPDRL
nr:DUF3558 family protein [Rhodococcus sp. HNM0569]